MNQDGLMMNNAIKKLNGCFRDEPIDLDLDYNIHYFSDSTKNIEVYVDLHFKIPDGNVGIMDKKLIELKDKIKKELVNDGF